MVEPGPGAMALHIEGSYKAVLQLIAGSQSCCSLIGAGGKQRVAVADHAARLPYTGSSEGVVQFL